MPTRRLTQLQSAPLDEDGCERRRFQGVSSLHFLKMVEDQGEVGFWTRDFATDTGTCSAGVYRMLSVAPGVAIDLLQMMHPDDREKQEVFEAGLLHGNAMNVVFRVIRSDGTVRWINERAEVLFDDRGIPMRAVGILRDVTERRELELIVDRTRSRHHKLLSMTGAIEWGIDANGRLLFRQGWAKFTGQDVSGSSGWGWLEMLHPDERIAAKLHWSDVLAHQSALDLKARLRCEDGSYRDVHIMAEPLVEAERPVTEWVGLVRPLAAPFHFGRTSAASRLSTRQIRAARSLLGWTHEDLARQAKVSVSSIRRVEEGGKAMRLSTYEAISKAFLASGIEFGQNDRYSTIITVRHGDQ